MTESVVAENKKQVRSMTWKVVTGLILLWATVNALIVYFSAVGTQSAKQTESVVRILQESADRSRTAEEATVCRARFAANVTDHRVALDDLNSNLLLILGQGVEAVLTDNDDGLESALSEYLVARDDIEAAKLAYNSANGEYQTLQAAQADPSVFQRMCRNGPTR